VLRTAPPRAAHTSTTPPTLHRQRPWRRLRAAHYQTTRPGRAYPPAKPHWTKGCEVRQSRGGTRAKRRFDL